MFVVVVDGRRLTMNRNFSWKSAFVLALFLFTGTRSSLISSRLYQPAHFPTP
jgi:hypothetical protein